MSKPIRSPRDSSLRRALRPVRHSGSMRPDLYTAFVKADLEVVRAVFTQDNRIAKVLDVDPAQLSRWGRSQLPGDENRTMLRVLADTVRVLAEGFEPSVIPGWFAAPRGGGEQSPAELLRQGRYEELREEVEASLQGAFS